MKTKCGGLKTFLCEICMKSYTRSDALKNHLKMIHACKLDSSIDNTYVTL